MRSTRLSGKDLTDLIEQAQAGDSEAMTALYDEFAGEIFRYALSITKNPDIAEDVASETFVRAWTHLSSYKGDGTCFRAYLYKIARNYAYDVLRKESHTTPLTDAHTPLLAENHTANLAIFNEQQRSIYDAVGTLPDIQRDIVVLRFFEGLSVAETANIIGCTKVNVRVVQYRALRELRKKLS